MSLLSTCATLLGHQGAEPCQRRNSRYQLLNTYLGGGIANVVRRARSLPGNRAAGAQNHNILRMHKT
jgi:hypothetical protein